MKIINDDQMLKRYISKNELFGHIASLNLEFSVFSYDKGEFIVSPYQPLGHILFVAEGTVRIYDISEEGRQTPVGLASDLMMLGDMEFCGCANDPFFAEAVSDVICLELPLSESRRILNQDIRFLQFLTGVLAEKIENIGLFDIRTQTVKERIIFCMENLWPDGTLNGMENTAVQLRCSRRQLLRALHELCEAGEISKTGRGQYRRSICGQH